MTIRPQERGVKPPLAEAAGKYLHAQQNAPLSPYSIEQEGTKYQDLPEELFAWPSVQRVFRVAPEREARWGWGSYAIGADGSLSIAHFNYDSSD